LQRLHPRSCEAFLEFPRLTKTGELHYGQR
jgi:hypothetical protein